jgi:hypothetical protein
MRRSVEQTCPAAQPVGLTRWHEARLRTLLGDSARKILPAIRQGISEFLAVELSDRRTKAIQRKQSRYAAAIAKKIRTTAADLKAQLKHADVRKPSMADLASDDVGFRLRLDDVDPARSLDALISRAAEWERTALQQAKGKPGRKQGSRRHFASWIARLFVKHEIPLRKSKPGKFAQTLLIVYEAAGLNVLTVYPDVVYAIERISAGTSKPSTNKKPE